MFICLHGVFNTLYPLDYHGETGVLTEPCKNLPVNIRRCRTSHYLGYSLTLGITISGIRAVSWDIQRGGLLRHTVTFRFNRSSISRFPTTGESTVIQIALAPAFSARRTVSTDFWMSLFT